MMLPRSFLRYFLIKISRIFHLRGGLDEFLHNFVIVSILAVLLIVGSVVELIDLQLRRQFEVVGVDLAGSGGEDGVAVLLGPPVEDSGEESRVAQLDLLIVGLYHDLLVEVVLHGVPQHQQVSVYSPQLRSSEVTVGVRSLLRQLLALPDAEQPIRYMMLYCSTWFEQSRCCRMRSMILATAGLISISSLKRSGSVLQQGSPSLRMCEKKMISNWLKWNVLAMCRSKSQGQWRGWLSAILCRISLDLYVSPLRTYSRYNYMQPLLLALLLPSRPTEE